MVHHRFESYRPCVFSTIDDRALFSQTIFTAGSKAKALALVIWRSVLLVILSSFRCSNTDRVDMEIGDYITNVLSYVSITH